MVRKGEECYMLKCLECQTSYIRLSLRRQNPAYFYCVAYAMAGFVFWLSFCIFCGMRLRSWLAPTMSPLQPAGSLLSLPRIPYTAITYRFLAPGGLY